MTQQCMRINLKEKKNIYIYIYLSGKTHDHTAAEKVPNRESAIETRGELIRKFSNPLATQPFPKPRTMVNKYRARQTLPVQRQLEHKARIGYLDWARCDSVHRLFGIRCPGPAECTSWCLLVRRHRVSSSAAKAGKYEDGYPPTIC